MFSCVVCYCQDEMQFIHGTMWNKRPLEGENNHLSSMCIHFVLIHHCCGFVWNIGQGIMFPNMVFFEVIGNVETIMIVLMHRYASHSSRRTYCPSPSNLDHSFEISLNMLQDIEQDQCKGFKYPFTRVDEEGRCEMCKNYKLKMLAKSLTCCCEKVWEEDKVSCHQCGIVMDHEFELYGFTIHHLDYQNPSRVERIFKTEYFSSRLEKYGDFLLF